MIECAAMFVVRANDRMCSDVYGARMIECAAMFMVRANDRMCRIDVYGARE